ncbi:carbohydrate binding domain-containing protein [Psychroserpens sp. Hel_I_66]|uniref:carbohydrate binding domain-containing protein n=1 Tax=Psychroserpens sp. Hel_I_66 TaxID=1250004 RepID=UPI00068A9B9E|nr:carbohydrate binding domain-containing protein [Psychroserpens sp. Hel_I_66]
MKIVKYVLSICLVALAVYSCSQDDDNTDFVDSIEAPINISANVVVTQDNTGLVTITPLGEGVTNYVIGFGDGSDNSSSIQPGNSVTHVYEEGSYDVSIIANGLNGLSTTATQSIVVSFQAPENLEVTIENDIAISKKVNVMASADFALSYEVDFGQAGSTPVMGNIDETVSFIYDEPGTYTITVTAFSAAIETLTYTEEFLVTEILAPLMAAPSPPSRDASDVVSIFSDAYTDVTLNELPTTWSSTIFNTATVAGNNVWQLSNLDFLGIVTNYDTGIDLSNMETMHIDYWVPSGETNELLVKIVNTVDGGEAEQSLGETISGSWQSIDLDMSGFESGDLSNTNIITQLLIDSNGLSETVFIDNFYFYRASTTGPGFDDGLLTNGDFENGSDSWIIGVDDSSSAPVVTNAGNTYYSVDVTAAGQPFDVNVSQKLEIVQGLTYTLSFDAWSDVNRSIIAGIGLSGGDFSNTSETVNINSTVTNYTLTLTAAGFGALDARVLFDLGAEIGMVNIDNVSLNIATNNLLTNGDFENGSDSWIIGVDDSSPAPVVTVGSNTYYSVDVTAAGQPFDVNVSQKLEIIQDETYTLTFDAWSDVNRSIIAGIGLSGGDFSNNSETVNITPTVTNFTLTLTAGGFGAPDARVLFDLGAEIGMVNIDNVVLTIN